MKLSRNMVRVIVGLIAVALAGLIILQYLLLKNSAALREQTYRRNVVAAMNATIEQLEEIDARYRILPPCDATAPNAFASVVLSGQGALVDRGALHTTMSLRTPERVQVHIVGASGSLDTAFVDSLPVSGPRMIRLPRDQYATGAFMIQMRGDSTTSTVRMESGVPSFAYTINDEDVRTGRVVRRLTNTLLQLKSAPLESRFAVPTVDSILAANLRAHDIPLAYDFGLFAGDSLAVARGDSGVLARSGDVFEVPLLNLDPIRSPESLRLAFPGYGSFVLTALLPELGAAIGLLAVIVFCFAYTIRTIVRQEEFAGRVREFINNMTHEFQTPISTIALAREALVRSDVRRSKSRTDRYVKVIGDENDRMKLQVEKILQMAALEEGEIGFTRVPVDIHAVIRRAADARSVLIAAEHGSIECRLEAERALIMGDPVHLENVIHNIVENAIKYSGGSPRITITSTIANGELVVRFRDEGVGIPSDHLERIFEKFYRVPSGNVHDVKGFGLGLSYVKLVMETHGGSVEISSTLGAGTEVSLRFVQNVRDEESGKSIT